MKRRGERGQAILEMAIILPIFILVGLGLADMQWTLGKVSSLEFVVNETARCQAIEGLPCTGFNTAESYAMPMAKNLHLEPPQLIFISSGCNPATGICTATMSYHYKPLGIYFPDITVTRTGTASMPKP